MHACRIIAWQVAASEGHNSSLQPQPACEAYELRSSHQGAPAPQNPAFCNYLYSSLCT
jgi:hypothetical protein